MKSIFEAMENLKENEFLNEMAYKIGEVDRYLIYVNSDDAGNIPHFHMVDKNSRGKDKKKGFHICIEIERAKYFHHTGKEDILNITLRKYLQTFLNQPFRIKDYNRTNWEFIRDTWNLNNSNKNVPENCKMPNYLDLE